MPMRWLFSRSNAFVAAEVCLFVLFMSQVVLFLDAGLEDALISARCARNFVRGAGLVYTPGEWVESVSNLSWTLLLAGLYRLGFDLVWAGRLLVVLASSMFWVAFRGLSVSLIGKDRWVARLPLLGIVFATYLPASFGSLLEGAGVAFCATALMWGMARRNWAAMAAAAIAFMPLRPEAPLFAVAAGAWLLFEAFRRRTPWAGVWKYMAFTECALLLLLLFRFRYFRDLIPNTVRAKGPGPDGGIFPIDAYGVAYILGYLRYVGPALLLFSFAGLGNKSYRPIVTGCLIFVALNLCVTGARGDWMSWYRFLTPYLPLILLASAAGIAALEKGPRLLAWGAAAVFLLSVVLMCVPSEILSAKSHFDSSRLRPTFVAEPCRTVAQSNLGPGVSNFDVAWPDDLLVIGWGGGNGWALDGVPVIEMLGLTHRAMCTDWPGLQERCSAGRGVHNWRAALDRNPTGFVFSNDCFPDMLGLPAVEAGLSHFVAFRGKQGQTGDMALRDDREIVPLLLKIMGDCCPVSDLRRVSGAPPPLAEDLTPWQRVAWECGGVSYANTWRDWGGVKRVCAEIPLGGGRSVVRRPLRDAAPLVLLLGLTPHSPLRAQVRLIAEYGNAQKALKTLHLAGNEGEDLVTCAAGIESADLKGATALQIECDAATPGALLFGAYRWTDARLPALPSEYLRASYVQAVRYFAAMGDEAGKGRAEGELAAFESSAAAHVEEALARKTEVYRGAIVLRDLVRANPADVRACDALDAYYTSNHEGAARCAEWKALAQTFPHIPEVRLRLAVALFELPDRTAGLEAADALSKIAAPSHPARRRVQPYLRAVPKAEVSAGTP